ncbi:FAD-dependent monooxygenase [Paraliomyxa miuraensis]|uniref:FAD-dependent monooxygenase n=1 Tax=Paraliomyxa miuraensis TaxID=376150 RepID=UPI0022583246|nr:FAD-dependent monooxygenase [Paraliomyxa miuraensis]MCX4247015.1 hypothetical protein [Paraliomyxa miuraensis]
MSGPTHGSSAVVRGSHAVVVGGGLGGLLAALVLRHRFERVTVLERDRWPQAPAARRGVPQGRCLHVLAAEGLRIIEGLVPGWTDALARAGVASFDLGAQARIRLSSGWLPRTTAGAATVACSRGLLEHVLRQRVEATPGVVLAAGHSVRRLLGDGARVMGVRVEGDGKAWDEPAELTVVSTGGRSALTAWWSELGLPPLSHVVVPSPHRYVSRWFEGPPPEEDDWRLLSITPAPTGVGGGVLVRGEGRRWGLALLVPWHRPAPTTDAELVHACASLTDSALHEALRFARPVTPIVRHERIDNRRLDLHGTPRWPEGLVVVGDAACTLDPYFGLGMSACARGVEALLALDPSAPSSARVCQHRVLEHVDPAWRLATEGEVAKGPAAYFRRTVLHLAPRHPPLARVLLRRMALLEPPEALERSEVVELVHAALAPPASRGSRSRPARGHRSALRATCGTLGNDHEP